MFRSLFPLAVQGTLRKKRSSILVFLVLLSFSCAIVSLSLTNSINDTNTQYRLDTSGEWYLAIPNGKDGDETWLRQQSWADSTGICYAYADILPSKLSGSVGTVDSTFLELARAELIAGRLPENEHETAVEQRVLEKLGYEAWELGETIQLPATLAQDGAAVSCSLPFTLVGVLNNYSALWSFEHNENALRPVCAILTEEGAETLMERVEKEMMRFGVIVKTTQPVTQLYAYVSPANRQTAIRETTDYLAATRDYLVESVLPSVNYSAYPTNLEASSPDEVYSYLIAVVALIAVLCVYLMQLQNEVHSFAVLRSIGITKAQLLVLMLEESLLLAVPAVLLGIPCGIGLTALALRLLLYSGSVSVQASVPYDFLLTLFALWLAAIFVSRLLIFAITVRTPLTGKMQMRESRARSARRFRRALVALLLITFGATVIYTYYQARSPSIRKKNTELNTDYEISGGLSAVSLSAAERLSELPGIRFAEGYMSVFSGRGNATELSIAFDGLEERKTDFYMIDETHWEDTLALGKNAEAFHNGDIVLLCFAESYYDFSLGENYSWDGPMPDGSVTLCAYENGECVATAEAIPLLWQQPKLMTGRVLYVGAPYTVICSEAYLKKLLSAMQPENSWGCYTAGEPFGYAEVWLTADQNAGALSADRSVSEVCLQEGIHVDADRRAEKQTEVQNYTQQLILAYACGGCVALVSLLLLASALALEAEQERRSYTILRVIGMSLRQMRKKIFGKALWRSVFAIVAGWALYAALCVRTQLALNELTFAEAAERAWSSFTYYGGGLPFIALLSAAMLAILLAVSLLAKRGLKQTTLLK